jgi:hypothetical protein
MTFARKHCVTVQEASEEYNINTHDIGMTDVECGNEESDMWDDEFENYGEGLLGGVKYWEWSKVNLVSDSDSEYSEFEDETGSEVGLEDLDFDEEKEMQKEAELLTFSEALRKAQVNAIALEKASWTTKRQREKYTGKSLSTLNRIARANAVLAKSGQKCESVEMAKAELDDEKPVSEEVHPAPLYPLCEAPVPSITSQLISISRFDLDLAWEVVQEFAGGVDMTLPAAEDLKDILKERYQADQWEPVLKAVMDHENDQEGAVKTAEALASTARIISNALISNALISNALVSNALVSMHLYRTNSY